MKIKHLLTGTVVLTLSFAALAAETETMATGALPPASTKSDVTYVADIKPIFEKSCVKCHNAEKPKAKLALTSLAGVLKGSKEGPVVKPGNSAGSVLVKAVAHLTEDPDGYMPPPHNKARLGPLKSEEIGLIRAWIDQGAK